MFEAFPSMKSNFAQISLPRLNQILTPPKPHPLAEHFQEALQTFFEQKHLVQVSYFEPFQTILDYLYDRREFYQLLSTSLLKILRRELKKMEELISLYSKPGEQAELNRIKLDKILKDCFNRLGAASECIHQFIVEMEVDNEWSCNCQRPGCQQRQSLDQFLIDVFSFFTRNSKAINRQIKYAAERKTVIHPRLAAVSDPQQQDQWGLNSKPCQLNLTIENNCQKVKKTKKRKKNKKNKEKQEEQTTKQENDVEDDQLENNLNNFLNSLQLKEEDRMQCIVTEQWVLKMTRRACPTKK